MISQRMKPTLRQSLGTPRWLVQAQVLLPSGTLQHEDSTWHYNVSAQHTSPIGSLNRGLKLSVVHPPALWSFFEHKVFDMVKSSL